ncbi:GtrA family protein [Achromobacter xylosoxidans]
MMKKELPVFLVVGGLTVAVDFLVYHALLAWSPMPVGWSKAIGFMAGTAFAYVANRYWTFNHQAHPTGSHWRFMALYAATLGANVVINTLTLKHLPASQQMVQVAFVAATGVSP